jgi:hypothetical protein
MARSCSGFQGFEELPGDIQTVIVYLGRCLGFHESEGDVVEGLIESHNGEVTNEELCMSAGYEPCNVNLHCFKTVILVVLEIF